VDTAGAIAGAAKGCAADLRGGHADENVPALLSSEPMEKTLDWAEGECEGYMRT
jgi:hypothetical protein